MVIEMQLETAEELYRVVEDAIIFHRTIKSGLVDAVIWSNVVPTKEGGFHV